jgi:Transcriptional Coactivator p15 (PC4)
MNDATDNPCWTIAKNARDEIRVELSHWNGSDRLNVRVWVPKNGVMIATKYGFVLTLDRADSLLDAVTSAVRVARERGLMA